MADKVKYIWGEQFAQKLPGSPNNPLLPNLGNYYFRTATRYKVDSNGKPIEGSATTFLYYAPKAGATDSNGETWTPGTADSDDNFNQGGWVYAGVTSDGKTYNFKNYTQEDADLGRIPSGKKVGDEVLGATAQLSLTTSGGRFYEAVQNNLINLATNTQPGLAQVVSAKQANTAAANAVDVNADVNAAVEERENISPVNIEVGKAKRRTDYGNYFYPNNLRSTQQDRIIFTMKYISGSKISANLGQKPVQRQFGAEEIKGSVTLPIQPSISDSSTVDWSGGRLNAVQAFGAAASLKLISSDSTKEFGENVSGIMGRIAKELRDGDYGEAFKIYFAQEAVGIQGLLSRAAGAILNPNLELLFNGPSLRPVNFSFKLSPRDLSEATQIRNIIRFFKQGMSVKTTDSEIFLKAPNVFDIRYITYDNNGVQIDHPSINRVKTCALLSCNVDYTPDGSYMTYNDPSRTMTSYQMNLQFSELDPIYDGDYNDDNNISTNDIGF